MMGCDVGVMGCDASRTERDRDAAIGSAPRSRRGGAMEDGPPPTVFEGGRRCDVA